MLWRYIVWHHPIDHISGDRFCQQCPRKQTRNLLLLDHTRVAVLLVFGRPKNLHSRCLVHSREITERKSQRNRPNILVCCNQHELRFLLYIGNHQPGLARGLRSNHETTRHNPSRELHHHIILFPSHSPKRLLIAPSRSNEPPIRSVFPLLYS